ncbi:molybdopterin synthase catalytic subunit [Lampris incognitus]|uniref:molybdopterin synthase catalytic subunit n=1 Tax=Lampris incognitus TaxID=2546036 RepID=UPI0024B48146|nr:molybdopterin synthase catalytic subunit [Lampris incognitus]XP_056147008.1 molybdopterin synthase catalytic subunit [Lampris incognitus]
MEGEEAKKEEVKLTAEQLRVEEIIQFVSSASCGATAVFLGTTRDNFEGRKVIGLEYEAYEPMAQSQLATICRDIRARWPIVLHICIHHRLGWVAVGEASVAIAISSPHRADALEAVEYCINTLKAIVPIWKKEVYEGEEPRWKENAECDWSSANKAHS